LGEAIREALDAPRQHPVFVPCMAYMKSGRRVTVHLMEGYAFVATGLPENLYFNLERDCPYVRKVLSAPSGNGIQALSVISSQDVAGMREQLREIVVQDISEDMRVRINHGIYAKLEGTVLHLQGDDASVLIEFRSRTVIQTLPKAFLEPVGEGS
jgi:hypothetical protein